MILIIMVICIPERLKIILKIAEKQILEKNREDAEEKKRLTPRIF